MADAYGADLTGAVITPPLNFTFLPAGVDVANPFPNDQLAPAGAQPSRGMLYLAGGVAVVALLLAMSSPRRR